MKHCPSPLKYVDVRRQTQTSFNNVSENMINDLWTETKGVNLSEEFTGIARFQILRTRLLEGYKWENGRPSKIQKTSRPHRKMAWSLKKIFTETNGKTQFAEWAEEGAQQQAARRNRGIHEVLADDQDYFKVIGWRSSETGKGILLLLCRVLRRMTAERNLRQLQLQLMPVRSSQIQIIQEHAEKWSDNIWTTSQKKKAYVGSFHYGLVHKPISVQETLKVQEAIAAVDKEWKEIDDNSSVGCRESEAKVRSHPSDEEGWKNSSPREFGGPLSLEERRTYKGRVVLRMDNVKDEGGYKAALTEQGASASQMAAARFLDTISKLLDMVGETGDAISTYTQVKMTEAPRLLRMPKEECPEIWIRIPPRQRPHGWNKIEDPAVLLERNLCGHPLAGLLWKRKIGGSAAWKGMVKV